MKRSIGKTILGTAVLAVIVACAQQPPSYAQQPPLNIDPSRHGNLARAQEFTRQAFEAMTAAQQANEYDLGGHAGKAKNLLFQASEEMKQAALAANRR